MTILSQDIKLLKSAVMADTSDGGGAMTGVVIVDGQSNNLFPDTSSMDRAFGRVNMRKVFGVAHTANNDTLLGTHVIITEAPADPLVYCSLMKSTNWADTRTQAQTLVERYLVKGPRLTCRLLDTHYTGSLLLNLISMSGSDFPNAGEAIVLRSPTGDEQFVRILKLAVSQQSFTVNEGSSVVTFSAFVATCDLGQELAYDFAGPAVARTDLAPASYSIVYTTTTASGAKFYGIKALGINANSGDYSLTTDSGIYSPLVPAATVESPLIDQYALSQTASLIYTATAPIALPGIVTTLSPNTVLHLPTAARPGTLTMQHGTTAFTDDGAGNLKQGVSAVGVIDYKAMTVTMLAGAPSYGSASNSITYTPATTTGAATHSAYMMITQANQGLAFTEAFAPAPAPTSFALSFMAQGRWYQLNDNGYGKLAGSDTSYGTGTLNYSTGSMAVTLGALPDVGSPLIATWGDAASAKAISETGTMPTGAQVDIPMPQHADRSTLTLAWSVGASAQTASMSASGAVSGGASGKVSEDGATFSFIPNGFPTTDVTISYNEIAAPSTGPDYTGSIGSITLTHAPIRPGSVFIKVAIAQTDSSAPAFMILHDNGSGNIISPRTNLAVGAINYTSGAVTFDTSLAIAYNQPFWWIPQGSGPFNTPSYWNNSLTPVMRAVTLIQDVKYMPMASTTVTTTTYTPTGWKIVLPVFLNSDVIANDLAFVWGGDFHFTSSSTGGNIRRGWSHVTGAAVSNIAGSVSSPATLLMAQTPSGSANSITWYNAAQDYAVNQVTAGVFRLSAAPIKSQSFQMRSGARIANSSNTGVLSGGNFTGYIDYTYGWARWSTTDPTTDGIAPATLAYNAVFLQYLPLDPSILGMQTARLPLDGKVPIYRSGDLVVVHNTQTFTFPNPLTKNTAYDMGRVRIASVKVTDATGTVVPDTLYTTDLDAGTITIPTASNITAYTQPLKVAHRIEDMLLCSVADISGKLKFTRSLTHNFPATTSFISSALPFGDLFSRAHGKFAQGAWTGAWSDTVIGSTPLADFNDIAYPITTTNIGAITERWALIFTSSTAFRIIGESVGEIGTGNTSGNVAVNNPATGAPYFSLPALGWGSGWSAGNVLRFNTEACGTPFWPIRTVLQGPASLNSDKFTIAFRGDVDRP